MSWFRMDDKSTFHAKTLRAGNEAWGAFVRMGTYSCDQNKGGAVDEAAALLIAGRQDVLDKLVSVGLIERADVGYQIHDFLDFNPSPEDVTDRRRKRAEAGKRGADRRWHPDSKPMASAMANASQTDSKPDGLAMATRCPDPDPDPDPKREGDPAGVEASPEAVPPAPSGTHRIPDPFGDESLGAAWAEGVREGSGRPVAPPRGAALRSVLDTETAIGRASGGIVERAAAIRELGRRYGQSAAPRMALNGFRFADWSTTAGAGESRRDDDVPRDDGPVFEPEVFTPERIAYWDQRLKAEGIT